MLALRHCLRFSDAAFPGGAAADNKRGSTACTSEGQTSPGPPIKFKNDDVIYKIKNQTALKEV